MIRVKQGVNKISRRSWKIRVQWKFRWIPVHLFFRKARKFHGLFRSAVSDALRGE